MAGSGGGYFSGSRNPGDLAQKTRDTEDKTRGEAFETDVGEYLVSLLTEYNNRDVEGIRKVFDQVINEIEDEIDGSVEMLFGGSISKNTYLDGISDVDALVILNKSELADRSPQEVKEYFASRLQERYGPESVGTGALAVTIELENTTIQFLPSLRTGDSFKIASSDGRSWSEINPGRFTTELTEANARLSGKLVPCIKLIKAIVAKLPPKRQITGYHVESVAIDVFNKYSGRNTTKSMLRHFFESVPDHLKQPIKDSSGQSRHVDDYLGPAESLQRRIVADTMNRIGRRIRNADGAQSITDWEELFE